MIGFQPVAKEVTIRDSSVAVPPIRLRSEVYDTGEVVVTSERPRDWHRQLQRFTREFLGTSDNAGECEIENPFVLNFTTESATNTLRATASRPLVIVNRALGYRVTFVLQDFEVSTWSYNIRFKGQPRFEELVPEDAGESKTWRSNREEAYAGSLQHFLFAVSRGLPREEGFELRSGSPDIVHESNIRLLPVAEPDSIVRRGAVSYERQFYSPEALHVTYEPAGEAIAYQAFVRDVTGRPYQRKSAQHSVLEFKQGTTLHTSGYLYEPYSVTTYGYWIWERVADMLPRNYVPASRRS